MKTKLLFLGLTIFLLASCTTEKKCARKFPPQIITKDSLVFRDVIKEVIIHDTIFIKADTVYNSDSVYIIGGLINSKPVKASTDFANAYAQVVNSKLFLQLIQNDTAIARLLKENVIVQEKEVYKTETIIKKVFEVHWYDKAARFMAILFILLASVLIFIKFIKPF